MMKTRVCELCNGEASLYCVSDSAFLCWNCDFKVHGVNFLVARHIRRTICSKCEGFDGNFMSGIRLQPFKPICLSCSSDSDEDDLDSLSSNSSSACISTVESLNSSATKSKAIKFDLNKPTKITLPSSLTDISGEYSSFPMNFPDEESSEKMKKDSFNKRRFRDLNKVGVKAEGILVNWCKKLGLNGTSSSVLPLASHVLHICLEKLTFLPFRVALASSFWFSLKYCGGKSASTCQNLKRVEEISGVPAKLIVLAEAKITRILNLNRRSNKLDDIEEGWAECSG